MSKASIRRAVRLGRYEYSTLALAEMDENNSSDFCEYCHTPLGAAEKHVTVYRHRLGQHIIFEHVPARVCSRCGGRYFSAAVVREMERLMQAPPQTAPRLSVPVLEFA